MTKLNVENSFSDFERVSALKRYSELLLNEIPPLEIVRQSDGDKFSLTTAFCRSSQKYVLLIDCLHYAIATLYLKQSKNKEEMLREHANLELSLGKELPKYLFCVNLNKTFPLLSFPIRLPTPVKLK